MYQELEIFILTMFGSTESLGSAVFIETALAINCPFLLTNIFSYSLVRSLKPPDWVAYTFLLTSFLLPIYYLPSDISLSGRHHMKVANKDKGKKRKQKLPSLPSYLYNKCNHCVFESFPFIQAFCCTCFPLVCYLTAMFRTFLFILLPGDPKKYSCLIKRKMHIEEKFSKLNCFWITNELTSILICWFQIFVVIWLRYKSSKSDKRFENCPEFAKNGLLM